ncbi:MAG: 16S rRNA (uracil(1498)-N(3))-methyltransferase [Burkholderiales bacterium]
MTPRLYCPDNLSIAVRISLPDSAAHHVARVLRLRIGDTVTLFDGSGGEYAASIHELNKNQVVVDVGKFNPVERESPLRVTLAQGLSVGDKMDDTLQKAVQLGIAEFAPIDTQKSIVRLTDERAQKRLQHWRQVTLATCEQCGRNRLPQVHEVMSFNDFVVSADVKATRLLLSPRGESSLNQLKKPMDEIILLCGPEAGFSDDEEAFAVKSGFARVRLGPRVLRTETAAVAALAAMNALWGDY